MTTITVDIQHAENELVMLLPNSVIGDGEPGDPLPSAIISLVNTCAEISWAPLDFGEAHGDCGELWFYRAYSVEEARISAKHFISVGGDV